MISTFLKDNVRLFLLGEKGARTSDNDGIIGGISSFIILLIIAVIIFVVWYRWKKTKKGKPIIKALNIKEVFPYTLGL